MILKEGNNTYTREEEMANKMAEAFSQYSSTENYSETFKGEKLNAEAIPIPFHNDNALLYNREFDPQEVESAINKLKKKTAPGPDEIHNRMIIELPTNAVEHLLKIYNKLWLDENFPQCWRESIVIPIPNPGKDHTHDTNYRPIALTNVLCKVMERMIKKRLLQYLEQNKVLSKFQCGGRRDRSTNDHLYSSI